MHFYDRKKKPVNIHFTKKKKISVEKDISMSI